MCNKGVSFCTAFATMFNVQLDVHGHLYVGKWQPIVAIKLSKDQGVLHFLNMADVSRLPLLGIRIVQLPWSAT